MLKPILIALSAVLLIPNFIDIDINERLDYDHKELFDPSFSRINSIDKLEQYIDSTETIGTINPNTIDYIDTIAQAIK